MEIRIIDEFSKEDIRLKNEPFPLCGRMVPTYKDEQWSYEVRRFPESEISETCFPEENYDFDAMKENSVFVGAYDAGKCIGLAILQDAMFKYLYLYDLKVCGEYRRQGVGRALLEKAKEVAISRGYRGIYTIGQDSNLNACLFYIKLGFAIGGFDNRVYTGTSLEGSGDILFYLDC